MLRWVVVANRGVVEEVGAQILLPQGYHRLLVFVSTDALLVVLDRKQFELLSLQISHPLFVGDLLAERAVARYPCLLLSAILPLHEAVALLQALQDLLLLI